MKVDNAQIIIDVAMGELQKKGEFSNQLSKIAQKSFEKGINNATKITKTALNDAINKNIYKETPASKRAIRRLTKIAMEDVNKEVKAYNQKHGRKGGFGNFLGSLMVNTGVLPFGQGYKGGNFIRDRYIDTYKQMDKQGNIKEYRKTNMGRVAGDFLSAGRFIVNALQGVAEIIQNGMKRIDDMLKGGLDNAQEIIAIAKTIGLGPNDDLRGVAAAVNAIDSLMAGTNYGNLSNMLTQYFSTEEGKIKAKEAGFSGKTALDMAMEYVQAVASNQIYSKEKDQFVNMTPEQLRAIKEMTGITMATTDLRRVIQQQASVVPGILFANQGKLYHSQETLYTKAYNKLGNAPFTESLYNSYKSSRIESQLERFGAMSKNLLSNTEATKQVYEELIKEDKERIKREINFFDQNLKEIIQANRRLEKGLDTINESIIAGTTKIFNYLVDGVTKAEPNYEFRSDRPSPLAN